MFRFRWPKIPRGFYLLAVFFVAAFLIEYFLFRQPAMVLENSNVESLIIDTGMGKENLPAIDDPNFESVPLADTYLEDGGFGVVLAGDPSSGLEAFGGSKAIFYPFQILVWHNLVNDVWRGQSILVAYDPLCGGAAVFEREAGLLFQNSGKIYNNSLLFSTEESNSLWRLLDGKIIESQGKSFLPVPSYVMTWKVFKQNFPNGSVLSRETGFVRDYSHNPYGNYAETPAVWFPLTQYNSTYSAKTLVYSHGSEVYPRENIKSSGKISGTDVDFVWDEDWETVIGLAKSGEEVALTRAYWGCWVSNLP